MAEPDTSSLNACPHCGQPIAEQFCAQCGEHRPVPLKLAELAPGVFEQLLQFEYPLARTLKLLASRPAELVRRYWAGDRRHFTHPFKLCFWAATLDFALVIALGLVNTLVIGAETVDSSELLLMLSIGQYMQFLYFIPVAWLVAYLLRPSVTPLAGYVALLYGFAAIHLLKALTIGIVLLHSEIGFWLHRLITPLYVIWLFCGLLPGAMWARVARGLLIYLSYVLCQIAVNSLSVFLQRAWQSVF